MTTHTNEATNQAQETTSATTATTAETEVESAENAPTNGALMGLRQDGSYKLNLGTGIQIGAALLGEGKDIDLSSANLGVPGLKLTAISLKGGERPAAELKAAVNLPRVDGSNVVTMEVSAEGEVGKIAVQNPIQMQFEPLNNPLIKDLMLDENRQFGATVELDSGALDIAGAEVEVAGALGVSAGKFSGDVEAKFNYPELGEGDFKLSFSPDGEIAAGGNVALTHPMLEGVEAEFGLEDEKLVASVAIPADKLSPPVPGLTIGGGTVNLTVTNGEISGGLEGVTMQYGDFASGDITASFDEGKINGEGTLNSTIPAIGEVTGTMSYQDSKFSGSVTLSSSDFPEALGIKEGTITANISEDGKMSFDGSLSASLGPVGEGTFTAAMDEQGNTTIAADVNLTIPGLQGANVKVALVNGEFEGEGDIPIDVAVMPGLAGAVHIEYKQNLWSGETELSFEADDGKISGTINVGVQQTEEKGLCVYGGGSLTMQLSDKISGTVGAQIDPDAKITLDMNISVEPLELFPEERLEKELFSYSQNIPLWGLLVAVIRMRAGVRAGIGPGQFRNISVTGTYEIGNPEGPDLDFTGELFIPAFAEGYVAFGAGLGVSVVIGSLTGGLEGVATAGIYGAVSVQPLLEYSQGDWVLSGTATMAAGARFKLSLNAWAEVEALWVTVWENTWELAEKTWNFGPDLAIQFAMTDYVIGGGGVPTIELQDPEMGSIDSMISEAMPKDSPAPPNTRAAVESQKGQWEGNKKADGKQEGLTAEQQKDASKSPQDDPDAQPPVSAPKKPDDKKAAPQDKNATGASAGGKTGDKDAAADNTAQENKTTDKANGDDKSLTTEDPDAKATVSESEVPEQEGPRHPATLTLETLNDAPVPTPRTPEQKKEDFAAAEKVLQLAIDQSQSADELDDYFAALQKRFGLTKIALVDTELGKAVLMEINPKKQWNLPYYGKGSHGLKTEVANRTATLGGILGSEKVGVEMKAKLLGPEHRKGKETSGSDQKSLMDQLPTDPKFDNDAKFIRGHLLNADLGGMNDDENLFPITGEANASHKVTIEKVVKDWVNDKKLWAFYQVNVAYSSGDVHLPKDATEATRAKANNFVNCHFKCYAHIWDTTDPTNLKKGEQFRVDIHSKYNESLIATDNVRRTKAERDAMSKEEAKALAQEKATARTDNLELHGNNVNNAMRDELEDGQRPEDADIEPELAKVKGVAKPDEDFWEIAVGVPDKIDNLKSVSGIGPVTVEAFNALLLDGAFEKDENSKYNKAVLSFNTYLKKDAFKDAVWKVLTGSPASTTT